MIQHVLIFWFKDGVPRHDVNAVLDGMARFADIPAVQTVAVSENRGDPARSDPFTHAAILTFPGIAERNAYIADERHVALQKWAMPLFGDLKTISVESYQSDQK